MWLSDKTLKIDPARYQNNSKVIYTDKYGFEHTATVLESSYKSLYTGYQYKIELDEPINGHVNYLVNESHLSAIRREKKTKKETVE